MVTTLKLEMSDEQRQALGLALTGRKCLATRQQISEWAYKLLGKTMEQADPTKCGPVRLQNMACPKCQRPISVPVPAPQAAAKGEYSPAFAKAAEKARAATQALESALADLRGAL